MKSKKVSFIASPGLEMELKAIPDTEYYRDISEFLEDAIKTLMDARRDLRTAIACTLYKKGKISLGRAMEIASVDIERMKEILIEQGIKISRGAETVDEMEEELKGLEI
jgi:predicted HTH domain antitoxin